MSDTPKTDAELKAIKSVIKDEYMLDVMADFARKLERERDEAREQIEGWRNKWNAAVEMAARAENERDDARLKIIQLERERDEAQIVTGETSDGFHTFNELYEHRCTLFLALMASNPNMSWASAKHFDSSAFDGWFVAGIELPTGDATYHLPDSMWEMAKKTGACIMDRGKEWDGHSAADVVERIQKWVKRARNKAKKALDNVK